MTHDNELRSRLSRLAEKHQLGDLTVDAVHDRNDRRVRRQRFVGVGMVLLLALAAAGIVRTISNSDDADVNVAIEPEDAVSTSAPATDAPTTTLSTGDGADTPAYGYDGNNVVAWGDGFLELGQVFVPSDVSFTDLVPDIADRFPAEVLEVIEAAGIENPGSGGDLQSSIDALTEAGLMDMVTDIFSNDPELLEAYSEIQAGGTYSFEASVSTDGETWTVLDDFALPGNATYFDQLHSNGSTVVVATTDWADDAAPIITISSSNDLVTWTSTVLPLEVPSTPSYVNSDAHLSGLAVGPNGWYATTGISSWIDLWPLVPADVRADFEEYGYSYSTEDGGIRISSASGEYYEDGYSTDSAGDYPADNRTVETVEVGTESAPEFTTTTILRPANDEPAPVSPPGEPAPVSPPGEPPVIEERFVTWDELGITAEEYNRYGDGNDQATGAFIGSFDGSLESVTPATSSTCCQVIATDAGFISSTYGVWNDRGQEETAPAAYFSADGRAWSELVLPAAVSPQSIVAVSGGVIATDSNNSSKVWRGTASGTNWQEVVINGLPEASWLSFYSGGHGGVASVIDAQPSVDYPQPEYTTVFEYEGFDFEIDFKSDGSSRFLLTDSASGDVLLDEVVDSSYDEAPAFIGDSVDSLEFLDADGKVIVDVPHEVVSDATESAYQRAVEDSGWVEPDYVYTPDYWLVASTDGLSWFVEDLPEIEDRYFGEVVVNGDIVIIRSYDDGDNWQVFSIG